jgi:DNA-binding Lrp family transcriptional regulator
MPKIQLDAIDRKIIACLQENARISNVDLAEAAGLSPSPCLRRVRGLEEAGVIKGYVALVNPSIVGMHMNIFVRVSLERQTEEIIDTFEAAVRDRAEVMECYLMSGDTDYHLRVIVPNLEAYEQFLKNHLTRIPGVANIKSSFALRQVTYRTALPI